MTPIRLTVVNTHPIQYNAPWFRYLAANCPELDVTVLYAARPSAAQQGVGFGRAFEWDQPLEEGYRCRVLCDSVPDADFGAGAFRGLDVPEIESAVLDTKPDVVMVPGWNSVTLVRAVRASRQRVIPVLYRGDTHLALGQIGRAHV